jgi:hypothetical protein
MRRHFSLQHGIWVLLVGLGLAGCGGSGSPSAPVVGHGGVPTPTPSPTHTATATPTASPTAAPAQHLYVGDDGTHGIAQYSLPISSGETPNFTIAATNLVGVAGDGNGNLVAGDNAGNIYYYTAPLSGTTVPAATFKNGSAVTNSQLLFDAGQLYAGTQSSNINVFSPPFTNASVPSASITNAALLESIGLTLDAAGNLDVVSTTGSISALLAFPPPFTTSTPVLPPPIPTSTAVYRKVAASGTQLFVASVDPGVGKIDVYSLPLTASSAPAFSITSGMNNPEAVAFDNAGNLYVGNVGNSTVVEFSPPFSSTSAPVATLTVGGGAFEIFGITIAP